MNKDDVYQNEFEKNNIYLFYSKTDRPTEQVNDIISSPKVSDFYYLKKAAAKCTFYPYRLYLTEELTKVQFK